MSEAITKLESWERPFGRLDRDWAVAYRRARKKFTKSKIKPDFASLATAGVLELWIKGTGPYRQEVTRGDLLNLLEEVYAGKCDVKLAEDGRVVAWENRRYQNDRI